MLIRFSSGAVYVAIVVFCVLFSPQSFNYLLLIFCGLCLYEYAKLVKLDFNLTAGLIVLSLAILLTNSKLNFVSFDTTIQFIKIPYLIILATIILITLNQEKLVKKIGAILFGVLYITVPFYLSLNFLDRGNIFIWFFVFFIVNDTFAYVTGVKLGKNKLAPKISPKKTIEGFIGGFIASILLGALLYYYYPQNDFNWIVIGFISSVFGTMGDLVESKLKREANVKDSANIIPGHGGFLDRLDSYIFALPFIYLYIHS
ncbi:phosphatidate cytidylyltransferase [Flavobacteriaceae bacterium UJ101]|nr:phosphatidate cytidylyltransferase [Flavobacteriaceae bacterium UJ101]